MNDLPTDKQEIEKRLEELQEKMNAIDFWDDKEHAQKVVQEYEDLKKAKKGVGKYDKRPAVATIYAGAGGQDAEDFARMLTEMYITYAKNNGWNIAVVHKNANDHGGLRNITFEIRGKDAYGTLKNESGVHRLVRISPFNANKKRHTSFAMVEIVPKMKKVGDIDIDESDLEVEFSRSSGPGGQNVNKRETAVRIVHTPTNITAHANSERSQQRNRDKALEILKGKLYHMRKEKQKEKQEHFSVSDGTKIEWGNQIRSYVLHPYKLVKDHRTDVEVNDVESVMEDGELSPFIEAEREL